MLKTIGNNRVANIFPLSYFYTFQSEFTLIKLGIVQHARNKKILTEGCRPTGERGHRPR
ncbi:hypothetical protein Y602_5849 [Burkholderia pseudomallei MSHR733]|nr:hypothetical protein Y602_5849 [Burkholderia pseudomallei MSHR733]